MSIEKRGHRYVVETAGLRLTWDEQRFTWAVQRGERRWESAQPNPDAVGVRVQRPIAFAIQSARRVETTSIANAALEGVACVVSDFAGIPRRSRLSFTLVLAIEKATGDLVVTIDGKAEKLFFQHLYWPAAVLFKSAAAQETIIPFMQGAVIPGRWPHAIANVDYPTQSRGLYMPWWGQRDGQAGYMAILETDADAGCRFEHPAGGPTHVEPRWDGSLGRFSYPRVIRYSFFKRCDYVSLCKHYRCHVKRRGRFISLREKIEATPKAARLIGSPVIHTGVAHTVHPASHYYDKEHPGKNTYRKPFRAVSKELRNLRRRGIARAYFHLDGWGIEGYDSHHPDYLPPCPQAGGWSGLRHLANTCSDLGYLFALHDQYRDYYHNASTYDSANAVQCADGKVTSHAIWYGGPQSVLCARFAPAYVLRNHQALRTHGIQVDGSYLDVFAIVPADECFHPAHRMNRRECLDLRAECFEIIRDLEGIASSEEPVDYAIPHLHLVHHGPFPIGEWLFGTKDIAVPTAPLWSLVYHDALFLPWGKRIHAALYGGMPYLDLKASGEEIAAVQRICRLHAKVALEEMVSHEFLSEDRMKQRVVFTDGTVVVADVRSNRWKTEKRPIKPKAQPYC